ncbi:MAG: hypothetical protein PUB57_08255 [Selenomonadaceae bacterium]|nr:hypothetical protein [Selenomonadaceae bacterium]
MRQRAKYFPYPILSSDTQDYRTSTFHTALDTRSDINDMLVVMHCQLQNDELRQLVDQGMAAYACHVECTQTCYRHLFTTQHEEETFPIPYDKLNGTVEISSFLVAVQDIPAFTSTDFTDDLQGLTFAIDRGCRLGVGLSKVTSVKKSNDGFRDAPSIFAVIKTLNAKQEDQLSIEYQEEKIQIFLSEEMFDLYHSLSHMPEHTKLLHSLFLVPALMKVFYELKGHCDEYAEKRWYLGLDAAYRKIGKSFADAVENEDPFVAAQKLLKNPIGQSLIKLAEGTAQEEGDMDED